MRKLGAVSPNEYIFTDVAELDITNREAVMTFVAENNINIIVNCAAYTNVDKAEDDAATAELINATAVRNLAEAVKTVDGTLFHVSTDYVFGAEGNTPRTEDMPTNPLGVYGVTKLHGEQAIVEVGAKALIFRTAWLYSEFGNNFLKTMLRLTAEKESLNVVFDQVGTPTYALDLAKAIEVVLDKFDGSQTGVYHYSNEGVCSWFDFTKMIAEYNGTTECDVQPCHSDEFPSPVKRPAYSVLDKTKIKEVFGVEVPYWTDSLKKCIENLKNNI
jgi:dTDP-4-dehydrorhamnose reductase